MTLCDPMGCSSPWNSLGQNTGVGSLSLHQGLFPTQGSNPGLPLCRWILGAQGRGEEDPVQAAFPSCLTLLLPLSAPGQQL